MVLPSVAPETETPFLELTIPYLRKRSYQSTLNIQKKYSENHTYTSYLSSYDSDGLKINSLLTIPKGTSPVEGWPAIVFVHGYIPHSEYQTTKNYQSYVNAFAQRGFVVFKIDLRGHGTSEGDAGGGYYSSDYVIDTLNAFAALQQYPNVNRGKVSLWGHSMAGNIVLRSFVIQPDIYKVVIWGGAVYTYEDMADFSISDASYKPLPKDAPAEVKRQQIAETYGTFNPESTFWQQVPATNYFDGVTGAIQIHHAKDDGVVSFAYSRNLISHLKKTQIQAELFEYPSGGHSLTGSSFNLAVQRSSDFLKE